MIWIFVGAGAVLVVAIAVAALGMVVGRLEHETRPALYEFEDAVDYIADRLPDEVTARVSYDDVRQVLRWHLDWFSSVGLSTRHGQELGDPALAPDDVVVGDDTAAVEAVVARSLDENGPDALDVVCILDMQMRYLTAIGALDSEDGDPGDGDRGDGGRDRSGRK
ncbi:MAG: hypothetical protein ACE5GB_11745 [Acidimicrobiales bacterium]